MSRSALTISVAQAAALIRERARMVLGVALIIFALVLTVGYGKGLVFVARGQLFLGEVLDAAAEDAGGRDADGVSGEIEILRSATLVERAIGASGMNVSFGPFDGRAPRYSDWLRAGRDFGALRIPQNELTIIEATPAGTERVVYVVEFADAVHYRVLSAGVELGQGELGRPLQLDVLSWTLLAGPERGPSPGARYEVAVLPSASAVLDVSERLRVTAPRVSGSPHYGRIVTLEFTAGSPDSAARFLGALLDAYLQYRQQSKVGKLVARELYLEGESRSVEEALQGVEAQLAAVRGSQVALWPGDEDSPLLVDRDRYRAAEARSMLEVSRLEVYSQGFSGPAPPLASHLDSEAGDTQLAQLSAALAEAERDLTDARQEFADDSSEVREQLARVADRTRQIGRYVDGRLTRAKERQSLIAQLTLQNDQRLDALERTKGALAELTRDQETYEETYTRLLKQKSEASLVIAKAVSKDRVIDPPRAVLTPASPNFREALSSGLFGLFVGVLWVLFRRLTAGAIQAEPDARRFLGDVPVLGAVPFHHRRQKRRAVFADVLEPAKFSGHSPYEEAFRLFGMSLCGGPREAQQQVAFVTSPGPLDGKTSCSLALGLAVARRGRRVLIIDAGPPRVVAARAEGAPQGLSDVLAGRVNLRGARVNVPTSAGELHVLSAGETTSEEPAAHADQLRGFLEIARARYDLVLVDVPGHVPTNALALVGLADCVLVVLRLRHTRHRALQDLLVSLPVSRAVALVIDERLGRRSRSFRFRSTSLFGKARAVASRA